MQAERSREHFEDLLLRVCAEVIGEDGEFLLDSSRHQARLRFASRIAPGRTGGLILDSSWLEAFFFMKPNLTILMLDDYASDDAYTTARVRELVQVVGAYLRGEGALESRRTLLGRRRNQMLFQVGAREWLAR